MSTIPPSELILNERGAIYHLDLKPDEIGKIIILVGDPSRVPLVSKYFDAVEHISQHREFVTHTGVFHHHRMSVVSTGIGTDNIDIVFNELDALVNIDFKARKIKDKHTSLHVIRIGTSGAMQADIPVDSFLASSHALALDNLMHFYNLEMTASEKMIINDVYSQVNIMPGIMPYITACSPKLLSLFSEGFHQGITLTAPGFYGPQGRVLRMGLKNPLLNSQFTKFRSGNYRISNFEMETSGIYALGRAMGHRCFSANLIITNRLAQTFSTRAAERMEILIETVLSQLLLLD